MQSISRLRLTMVHIALTLVPAANLAIWAVVAQGRF
jgi:hypothetical protein